MLPLRALFAALPLCLALLAGGCGGSDRPAPRPAPPERFDPRPQLPDGWRRAVNLRAGFSIGLPPGWRASVGRITTIRSPDAAVSGSISADRSDDGQSPAPLQDYARGTIRGLRGYRALRPGAPVPLRGTPYPAVITRARGTFRATGVPQDIVLATIRRPGRVTFTLLFFRNARVPATVYEPAIRRMIRTFRAQPPRF